MDTDRLQRAVSGLWEAAIDHTQWSAALDEVAKAAGAAGACILSPNPEYGCLVNDDLREAFDIYFRDGWHELDVRRKGIDRLMRGHVLIDQDVLTSEDIASSPYYNEFLPKMGIRWWMGAGFTSGESFYCLALQRGANQGLYGEDDRAAFAELRPALDQLGRLLDVTGKTALEATISTLERLSVAAICIGANGEYLRGNALADSLYDARLGVRRKRLWIADERSRERFDYALRQALSSWTPVEPLVVHRPDRPVLILRLVKLAMPARSAFFGAPVLVTLKELKASTPLAIHVIGRAFGLTQAECRLAGSLAGGLSLEESAQYLRISKETARNQLKAVFSKTQTNRQGQLVALLSCTST